MSVAQGKAYPDLIWSLLLWIEALGHEHRPERAHEAAGLGERRLALRRLALASALDELACSLGELILLTFEDDLRDSRRVCELRRELDALPGVEGDWHA